MKQENNVVDISNLISRRLQREDEVAYYTEQLEILQARLNQVRHEINLTHAILNLIKKESEHELDFIKRESE